MTKLGFGCYRITQDNPTHKAALIKYLTMGGNLIDTAVNYGDGQSESLVGEVLSELSEIKREDITVISKVGYLQGLNLQNAIERENIKNPYPEMVKYSEGCWHCIHPVFLEEQLTNSLQRLQLDSIDCYLLHNPEYYLMAGGNKEEYYTRLKNAFKHLEIEVKKGRIKSFGISSNTLVTAENTPHYTSLQKVLESAEHSKNFQFVQMPGNLFESGFLNNLELSKKNNVKVLLNRPLNAIINGHLIRLANFTPSEAVIDLKTVTDELFHLEETFRNEIAIHLQASEDEVTQPKDFFRWSEELKRPELLTLAYEHWQDFENYSIRNQIYFLINQLNEFLVGNLKKLWEKWYPAYLHALEDGLLYLKNHSIENSERMSEKISTTLIPFLPEEIRRAPLSQKALSILLNTEGVDCVLNGMRTEAYVEDSMGTLKLAPFEVKKRVYESFQLNSRSAD
jgi:aryl-alcohol dehydrogenase-like predicted oxidoreductase